MDIRFGTWVVRSLCRAGSLETVANKLAKYELDVVAIQEVRWGKGGSHPVDNYRFFCGNGNANHHLGTSFFVCQGIRLAVKMVKLISDRMSYVTQRDHWCDVVLNVHAPIEE
jgi:hypothetical protein